MLFPHGWMNQITGKVCLSVLVMNTSSSSQGYLLLIVAGSENIYVSPVILPHQSKKEHNCSFIQERCNSELIKHSTDTPVT